MHSVGHMHKQVHTVFST